MSLRGFVRDVKTFSAAVGELQAFGQKPAGPDVLEMVEVEPGVWGYRPHARKVEASPLEGIARQHAATLAELRGLGEVLRTFGGQKWPR